MNRKNISSIAVVVALATGIAAFAWAKEERRPRSQDHNRSARMMEERLASLPAAEQTLAKSLRPLKDSLGGAVRDYLRKVHEGAAPRSLVAERAKILALKSEISRLEAADPETSLDLLAHLPPPIEGMRGPRRGPPPCPMMGGDNHPDGGDSAHPHCPRHAPPPPPED